MYYDDDDYNAYDDYDRHRHTGEFSEWFDDEQEEGDEFADDCLDDTTSCNNGQIEKENRKVRDGCAGCILLVMIAILIAAILITKF